MSVCKNLAGFLLIAIIAVQGQQQQPVREQTTFSERFPIRQAVTLSPQVLKILMHRLEIRNSMERADDSQRKDPAQLFLAAEVHLSGGNDADLLIQGAFPLTGADNNWFWIVRSERKTPEVILWAGAYSVEVLVTKTNGYRDIRSIWGSPNGTETRLYKFDGKRYRLSKEKWRDYPAPPR